MEIRQISDDKRVTLSLPLQAYAFQPSPATPANMERLRDTQQYYEGNLTLVAEDDGVVVADASAIPMRQNVRGTVFPMAGIAGVASDPSCRRRGYARAILVEILCRMRDQGHPVSALYPFRPSFYERLGYAGLPKVQTVVFSPADLHSLLRVDLPGEVTWEPVERGYETYRGFTQQLLRRWHGFAVLPDFRAAQLRDLGDRWLATARVDGEVVGAVTYRIAGYGGDLLADGLLTINALGRALLLQFFARHVDQVARVVATVAAGEMPELWATDLATVTEARISFPGSPAPMARVLSLDALAGLETGPGRVVVEVVDDSLVGGRYLLDGMDGRLQVLRDRSAEPSATVTVAGLSGLVYGVFDPDDVIVRGLGRVSREAADQLRTLLPRCAPYVFANF